ncbi:spore germination protein GerPB [Mesobacillus foraminis]|uniref:Spore germination protein PB n=1 Tax=Mesobacillus foraminis TaxID=279826 RepID=A0A4R2BMQ8_9BACI|nr:spore germination protein GerPB [Mesobacillus foraminis]MBT2756445.1 spore germination protein GerPB [Mesobacillus foraminis]TCN27933.1 spore germination protein PB [Mesobacillus foraminis]
MANFYIQQSISINLIRIDGITNSSVLQIGSAGVIKPASYLYNTGGFKGPAPQAVPPGSAATGTSPQAAPSGAGNLLEAPAVPLQSPT